MVKKTKPPAKPPRHVDEYLIYTAISEITDSKGASYEDIKQYILKNFNVIPNFLSVHVRLFIERLLEKGMLEEMKIERRFKVRPRTRQATTVPKSESGIKKIRRLLKTVGKSDSPAKVKEKSVRKKKVVVSEPGIKKTSKIENLRGIKKEERKTRKKNNHL